MSHNAPNPGNDTNSIGESAVPDGNSEPRNEVSQPASTPNSSGKGGGKQSSGRRGKRTAGQSNEVSPVKSKTPTKEKLRTTPKVTYENTPKVPPPFNLDNPGNFSPYDYFQGPMGSVYNARCNRNFPNDLPPSYDEATGRCAWNNMPQPYSSMPQVLEQSRPAQPEGGFIPLSQLALPGMQTSTAPTASTSSHRRSRSYDPPISPRSHSSTRRDNPQNDQHNGSVSQFNTSPVVNQSPQQEVYDDDDDVPAPPPSQDYVPIDSLRGLPRAVRPQHLDLGYQNAPSGQAHQNGQPVQAQLPPDNQGNNPAMYGFQPFVDDAFDTITVREVLNLRGEQKVEQVCNCYVIEMEPSQPVHPQVHQPRRKICVGDKTGVMVGYIKRPGAAKFEKDDTIRMRIFTRRENYFLIHSSTSAAVTEPIEIIDDIRRRGRQEFYRPEHPIVPICQATNGSKGKIFSIFGKVTTTENARVVGTNKDRLVKTVGVKDATGEIRCSLWGAAANKCAITLGQQITLNDATLSWNGRLQISMLNVNESDQVIIGPAQDLQETIKVHAVEDTENYNTLLLDVTYGRSAERLTVDRYCLSTVFGVLGNITVRQLVNYLPFRAKVNINGQNITSMNHVTVSPLAAQRLMGMQQCGQSTPRGQSQQHSTPRHDTPRGQPQQHSTPRHDTPRGQSQQHSTSRRDAQGTPRRDAQVTPRRHAQGTPRHTTRQDGSGNGLTTAAAAAAAAAVASPEGSGAIRSFGGYDTQSTSYEGEATPVKRSQAVRSLDSSLAGVAQQYDERAVEENVNARSSHDDEDEDGDSVDMPPDTAENDVANIEGDMNMDGLNVGGLDNDSVDDSILLSEDDKVVSHGQ